MEWVDFCYFVCLEEYLFFSWLCFFCVVNVGNCYYCIDFVGRDCCRDGNLN